MLLAGPASVEAGKKRRNASLDRLKQRSASERWQRLQTQWLPFPSEPRDPAGDPSAENPPSAGSDQPNNPVHAPGDPSMGARTRTRIPSPPVDSSPAVGFDTQHNEGFYFPAAVDPRDRAAAFPDVPSAPASRDSVWIIAEDTAGLSDEKRTASRVSSVSSAQVDTTYRQQATSLDDARPKPISAILPYYDYSPNGEDPCEILCPRPDGCPDDDLTKLCPELVELPNVHFESRAFADAHVFWEASNLFSNPLYFEDAPLERYGHTHGPIIQPLVSVGKFGAQLVGLPYQMALHPIHEHRYAIGWYRPGECAPYKYYLPPWNARAALTAGAAYTGLIFLIP